MSNTSDLSPYDSTTSSSESSGAGICAGILVACAAGAVIGAAALTRWLAEETPHDRAAVERLKEERRKDRLKGCIPTHDLLHTPNTDLAPCRSKTERITTVNLNIRHLNPLVEAVQKLGYRPQPLPQPQKPVAEQAQILFVGASGERLAIERNAKGRLAISTSGGRDRIQALVRQHTIDRATEHLKSMGMGVRTTKLANGEVQILAHEQAGKRGGAAEVKAQICGDGRVWIDVDKIRGNRCEEIVSQLAEAIGAEVSGTRKKDAYYQLPGEPAKTQTRV